MSSVCQLQKTSCQNFLSTLSITVAHRQHISLDNPSQLRGQTFEKVWVSHSSGPKVVSSYSWSANTSWSCPQPISRNPPSVWTDFTTERPRVSAQHRDLLMNVTRGGRQHVAWGRRSTQSVSLGEMATAQRRSSGTYKLCACDHHAHKNTERAVHTPTTENHKLHYLPFLSLPVRSVSFFPSPSFFFPFCFLSIRFAFGEQSSITHTMSEFWFGVETDRA